MTAAVLKHRPVKLFGLNKAYGLIVQEPEIAVIFVHGFLGDARATWVDFQHLIDTDSETGRFWGRSDLFFYSYPSHDQILPLAEGLSTFVNDVLKSITIQATRSGGDLATPNAFTLPSGYTVAPQIQRNVTYKHLIFVAHSTGALIVRQTVLQELKSLEESDNLPARVAASKTIPLPPILMADLRFFAPAHRGVLGAGWLGIALNIPFLDLFFAIWLHSNPLYRSLTAPSPALEDLKDETERLYLKYPEIPGLKALCLFGSKEAIVFSGAYSHDKLLKPVEGQTHTSICKPTHSFRVPLKFVTEPLESADAVHGAAAGS